MLLHAVDLSAQIFVLVAMVCLGIFILVPAWVIVGCRDSKDHATPLVYDAFGQLLDRGHIGPILRIRSHYLEQSWAGL